MKKTILSLAVLFATSFSFSALAQAPAEGASCSGDKPECCETVLFEGIILTPDQQTKIQELNASRAQAAKVKKEAAKQKKEAAKADRKAKAEAKKADRKDYLNSVKSVLTPDQYVIFLENAYVNAPARMGKPDGKIGKAPKGDMKAFGGKKGKMVGKNGKIESRMKAKAEAENK